MIQRQIPSSGEWLPVLGVGTWQRFDAGPSESQLEPLRNVLGLLVNGGGKLIDSSPMYGRAETAVGELTSEQTFKDQLFYATKVWTSGREQGVRQMESSFQKMGRRVMDLMQVHNLVDWHVHMGTLSKWKSEGRIRYTGLTHYTASHHDDLGSAMKEAKPDFIQVNYSVAETSAADRLLPMAQEQGVAVIINEPLARGTLFKAVRNVTLPQWAVEAGMRTWSDFFIRFIVAHPAVTVVIPATANAGHMKDNLAAAEGPLPDEATLLKMKKFIREL